MNMMKDGKEISEKQSSSPKKTVSKNSAKYVPRKRRRLRGTNLHFYFSNFSLRILQYRLFLPLPL